MKEVYPYLAGFMMVSIPLWFFLCWNLYRGLERFYPEKYESMGRPTLFTNNTFKTNVAFMKFLLGRQWNELGSRGFAYLGRFMLTYMAIYTVVMIVVMAGLPLGYSS